MLQPALSDCLFLDLLSHFQDRPTPTVVDVGRRQVIQALVVSPSVVVSDEVADLAFKIPRQIVVLQQNPVLHGLVPAFDLALGLWVVRRSADVIHTLGIEVVGQVGRNIGRAVVA